jgi:hypothetical protein
MCLAWNLAGLVMAISTSTSPPNKEAQHFVFKQHKRIIKQKPEHTTQKGHKHVAAK